MEKSEFLIRRKKPKTFHIWNGKDTNCRMYSTGGMNHNKYMVVEIIDGLEICTMCKSKLKND